MSSKNVLNRFNSTSNCPKFKFFWRTSDCRVKYAIWRRRQITSNQNQKITKLQILKNRFPQLSKILFTSCGQRVMIFGHANLPYTPARRTLLWDFIKETTLLHMDVIFLICIVVVLETGKSSTSLPSGSVIPLLWKQQDLYLNHKVMTTFKI